VEIAMGECLVFPSLNGGDDSPLIPEGKYGFRQGAIEILQRLANFRNIDPTLTFFSARCNLFYRTTKSYLHNAFPGPVSLFNGISVYGKWEYVRAAKLDFYVEDCWNEAIHIAARTNCIVFLLDYPYNQAPVGILPEWEARRLIRVKSWYEILPYVLEKAYA